jgi:hypothetical protein
MRHIRIENRCHFGFEVDDLDEAGRKLEAAHGHRLTAKDVSDAELRDGVSAKSDVVSRTGSARERMPAPACCISRAITRSVVSRDSRSTAGMMTTLPGSKRTFE